MPAPGKGKVQQGVGEERKNLTCFAVMDTHKKVEAGLRETGASRSTLVELAIRYGLALAVSQLKRQRAREAAGNGAGKKKAAKK